MNLFIVNVLFGCAESEQKPSEINPEPSSVVEPSEEEPCTPQTWFVDGDGDGYGNPYNAFESCSEMEGYVLNNRDCDDNDATEFPGQFWYSDSDGDGFGNLDFMIENCSRPIGYVVNSDDCDDTDSSRNPESMWYEDIDNDGFGVLSHPIESCTALENASSNSEDCDDGNALIHPNANEICDYIDNNCDLLIDDEDPSLDTYTQVPLYRDDDDDGYGTIEYVGHGCASSTTGSHIQGDCDDTDGDVFPGNFELPDEVDQNCDGENTYQNIDYTDQGIKNNIQSTYFGRYFYNGDFNGDGVDDLLIGMPIHDQDPSAGDSSGKVMWIDGTTTFDLSAVGEEHQYWTGEEEGDEIGYRSVLVGDMDGDGLIDAMIDSKKYGSNAGAVYLTNANTPTGSLSNATWSWKMPNSNSSFGSRLLPIGDVDADGLDDVLVSATYFDTPNKNIGAVFVLRGSEVNVSDNPLEGTFKTGKGKNDLFGASMAKIGDADGDGIDELLISAPQEDDTGNNSGNIYLMNISDIIDPALELDDCTVFQGELSNDKAGERVFRAGDVNDDGYKDFFILSITHPNDNGLDGLLYLINGKSTFSQVSSLGDSEAKFHNDLSNSGFATDVEAVEDMNGDGVDDFLIGSPFADVPSSNRGHVLGYYGGDLSGTHNISTSAGFLLHGSASNEDLGYSIVSAGDRNGDNLTDLWIGAPGNNGDRGAIYLFSGFAQ